MNHKGFHFISLTLCGNDEWTTMQRSLQTKFILIGSTPGSHSDNSIARRRKHIKIIIQLHSDPFAATIKSKNYHLNIYTVHVRGQRLGNDNFCILFHLFVEQRRNAMLIEIFFSTFIFFGFFSFIFSWAIAFYRSAQ